MAAAAGGGEVMRAFWAKVVGRSGLGGWGGLDANELKGEVVVDGEEKGLAFGDCDAGEEDGF